MNGVIYARYSSDNQREESIEGQLRECLEFADRQGITVVGNYIDRAMSAKTDDRPDFQRMIKDSAKHIFDVIIVWKLDRFARNRYDSARYKAQLKKNGVRVVSAKENISDRPEGILLESMLEGYAEYYSAELSEKVIRGMTENALKCKYNGSTIPYGFTLDAEKHFQLDPIEAAVVKELYIRFAAGEPSTAIMNDFNARGLKNKSGKPFSKSVIVYMLHNRRYTGEYRFMDIITPGGMPQIVSEELYEKVQERFVRNKKMPPHTRGAVDFLLTTKLYCGKCGAYMAGESGTSRTGESYYYYKCSHAKRKMGCTKKTVRKDWIEDLVIDWTVRYVLQDSVIDRMADAVMEMQNAENTTLISLRKRLAENRKSTDNLIKAVEQGLNSALVMERISALEVEKNETEKLIAKEEMKRPILTKEQIVFWINQFKTGDIHDETFRRQLIDSFVNSIYLYDDKLVILYNAKDATQTASLDSIPGSHSKKTKGSARATIAEP